MNTSGYKLNSFIPVSCLALLPLIPMFLFLLLQPHSLPGFQVKMYEREHVTTPSFLGFQVKMYEREHVTTPSFLGFQVKMYEREYVTTPLFPGFESMRFSYLCPRDLNKTTATYISPCRHMKSEGNITRL